jgi:hypothetical protein
MNQKKKDTVVNGIEVKHFQIDSNGLWLSTKKIKTLFDFSYFPNIICFCCYKNVMMDNFAIRINLKWNI